MRPSELYSRLLSVTVGDLEQWHIVLGIGMPVIFIALVILFFVKNAEQIVMLAGKLAGLVRDLSIRIVKIRTEKNVRSLIVKSNKRLKIANEDAILMEDLKIDWAKGENARAYIENDHVIIRLRSSSNPMKNFVNAVTAYVSTGLLAKVTRYFKPEDVRAMSMLVARNIIIYGDGNALEYFDQTVLQPVLEESTKIRRAFQKLSVLDNYGMFYSILLREYSRAGKKVYPKLSDSLFTKEADELLQFLYQIAAGRGLQTQELFYESVYFSVRVMMTVNYKATEDFIRCGRQIQKWVKSEPCTIYVLANGGDEQNVRDALRHVQETTEKKLYVAEHVCKKGLGTDMNCYHCFEVQREENMVYLTD